MFHLRFHLILHYCTLAYTLYIVCVTVSVIGQVRHISGQKQAPKAETPPPDKDSEQDLSRLVPNGRLFLLGCCVVVVVFAVASSAPKP